MSTQIFTQKNSFIFQIFEGGLFESEENQLSGALHSLHPVISMSLSRGGGGLIWQLKERSTNIHEEKYIIIFHVYYMKFKVKRDILK